MPKMDGQMAAQTAQKLILSYPNLERTDPKVLATLTLQLTNLLTGQDDRIAEDVLHPEMGMPGQSPRLSAYELNQWLARWHIRPGNVPDQPKMLPEPPFTPPTDEERERVKQVTRILKSSLRDATEAMKAPKSKDGKPLPPRPKSINSVEYWGKEERDAKLLEALSNSAESNHSADALTD